MSSFLVSKQKGGGAMFGLEIKLAEPPQASKTATEKYVMAMYGKSLLEFARGLESNITQKKQNGESQQKNPIKEEI